MLKVVFTGSSLLQILNARADLSRRAISYTMQEVRGVKLEVKLEKWKD
jgi:hypothetical protein